MPRPFSSGAVDPANGRFDYSTRLVLEVSDLSGSYLFANLCSMDASANRPVSLAVSRICLTALPRDRARNFRFPVMSGRNAAIVSAYLSLTGKLSDAVEEK
jgi:hypothetical protein